MWDRQSLDRYDQLSYKLRRMLGEGEPVAAAIDFTDFGHSRMASAAITRDGETQVWFDPEAVDQLINDTGRLRWLENTLPDWQLDRPDSRVNDLIGFFEELSKISPQAVVFTHQAVWDEAYIGPRLPEALRTRRVDLGMLEKALFLQVELPDKLEDLPEFYRQVRNIPSPAGWRLIGRIDHRFGAKARFRRKRYSAGTMSDLLYQCGLTWLERYGKEAGQRDSDGVSVAGPSSASPAGGESG